MDSHTSQNSVTNEEVMSNMMHEKISQLEEKNKMLESKVNQLSSSLQDALYAINSLEDNVAILEKRCLSMEDIKKWTCEYIERELDDIHPLKDRWEATDYLPEYDGCIGYYYCPPGTPWYKARENAQIHYNRSEVMKQPEIQLSD